MEILQSLSKMDLAPILRKRDKEVKLWEKIGYCGKDWEKELQNSVSAYALIGIPEDIGVRANLGRPGAASAFKPALESFLNQQSNNFLSGSDIMLLGEVRTADLMAEARLLDPKKNAELNVLRELVSRLDVRVSEVIERTVRSGKVPLIIGGGHNNSYGNIKGLSSALGQPVNVINCDPHLDFRPLEGRHSGNGFSYAFEEGFIDRYAVFSIHEQYNSQNTLAAFSSHSGQLMYKSFEQIFVRGELEFGHALQQCISFVKQHPCGVEIDIDAITNAPSSAKTSSGITALQARQFAYYCGLHLQSGYFHIAEAAPVLSHIKADNKTGKLIAYLLSDFLKGRKQRSESMERKTIGFNAGS